MATRLKTHPDGVGDGAGRLAKDKAQEEDVKINNFRVTLQQRGQQSETWYSTHLLTSGLTQ
jgi:hypothetical protein